MSNTSEIVKVDNEECLSLFKKFIGIDYFIEVNNEIYHLISQEYPNCKSFTKRELYNAYLNVYNKSNIKYGDTLLDIIGRDEKNKKIYSFGLILSYFFTYLSKLIINNVNSKEKYDEFRVQAIKLIENYLEDIIFAEQN